MNESTRNKLHRELSQFLTLCYQEKLFDNPRKRQSESGADLPDLRAFAEKLALAFDMAQAARAVREHRRGAGVAAGFLATQFDLSKVDPKPIEFESPDKTRVPFALISSILLEHPYE